MNRTSTGLELLLSLDRSQPSPLHAQIEEQLRDAIRAGRLPPGTRLPSTRALSTELNVSRGVLVEAYGQLVAEGYLTVQRGAAPTVADAGPELPAPAPPAAPAEPRYDLRPGKPDLAAFPRAAWAVAVRRAVQTVPDADLAYPDPAGHPALRAALGRYLGRVRGVAAPPERIVIVHGVAQAVMLAARALGARGRLAIAVEDPSHRGSRELLNRLGVELLPVPVDERGMVVSALPARAAAALVTPAHQFPTGVVLAPERRAALVAWARRAGALIIEDDYDAEYRYDRPPVGAVQGLAPDRVLYTGSVSKTLAPALRLGWAVAPPWLQDRVVDQKWMADLGSPVLEQVAFADWLERGEYDRHLRRTRPAYLRRRDALLEPLLAAGLEVAGVAAGLHVVVWLPNGCSEEAVQSAAAARSVAVQTLGEHSMAVRRGPALLLGYSRISEAGLRMAARLLLEVIDQTRSG
jgi:GntR family transcriptional regulator/MocR family aminotransferase